MMAEAESSLTALALPFLEQDKEDSNYVLEAEIEAPSGNVLKICERMSTYLNAYCKDLVEVASTRHNAYPFLHANFSHHLVKDFAEEQDIAKTLKARKVADFDPPLYLLKAFLYQVARLVSCPGQDLFLELRVLANKSIMCSEKIEI